eukprot:2041586-Prymnesium_polylepis.1
MGLVPSLPVDIQMTDYALNTRAYDASSATLCAPAATAGFTSADCLSGVGSTVHAVTLRQGRTKLNVTRL